MQTDNTDFTHEILQVIWKYFYSQLSPAERGTLYQLRNKLNRTNVVLNPTKDFNACDDFFVEVITGHIVAAAMAVLDMNSRSYNSCDTALPHAQDIWMQPHDVRRASLDTLCKAIFDRFVQFSFNEAADRADNRITAYAKNLLAVGCFYLEFSDAIREGDRERVLHCWRYLLPMFLGSGRTNYSCEVVNKLYQHIYSLPPRMSAELLWSRFINVHGPGKNIPADLHMEHLNRTAKDAIKGLGTNKSSSAISRVDRAIGTLVPVLDQFDKENCV